jgi:hypothetical protein
MRIPALGGVLLILQFSAATALAKNQGFVGPANDFSTRTSSSAASTSAKTQYNVNLLGQEPAGGGVSIGVGAGISDGKGLETLLWGSAGTAIGTVAGPLGAAIGGAVGAFCGLMIGIFIVPKNGPDRISNK